MFTIFFVGLNNIWFSNTNWLYGAGDLTNAQLGWQYFHHDKWHFPIGKNPNYGLEISNSIVFTDNIPLFAIFFKIFVSAVFGGAVKTIWAGSGQQPHTTLAPPVRWSLAPSADLVLALAGWQTSKAKCWFETDNKIVL